MTRSYHKVRFSDRHGTPRKHSSCVTDLPIYIEKQGALILLRSSVSVWEKKMNQRISSNWVSSFFFFFFFFFFFCFAFVACDENRSRRDFAEILESKLKSDKKKGKEESKKRKEKSSADSKGASVVPDARSEVPIVDPIGNFQSPPSFQMRGANYVRLRRGSDGNMYHSTFGVDQYDASRAHAALDQLSRDGYKLVRVFVSVDTDDGIVSQQSGATLNERYLANLRDFLAHARSVGISVVITTQWAPGNYVRTDWSPDNNIGGMNGLYLNPKILGANLRFFTDLAAAIHAASLDSAVYAFDLHNEGEFNSSEAPLNSNQWFKAPNGASYDLGSSGEKQRLMDDSVAHWIYWARESIRSRMPNVLVTQSVFSPFLVRGSSRVPFRLAAIEAAPVDYLDAHVYAQNPDELDAELKELGVGALTKNKRLIVGELGALQSKSISDSVKLVRAMFDKTCRSGFSAWMFWTWDSHEQTDWHNLYQDGGALNGVFAPVANQLSCNSTPSCMTPEGFFRINEAIYYSNGKDSFCVYKSWDDYKRAGGSDDWRSIRSYSAQPTCFRNDGICVVR